MSNTGTVPFKLYRPLALNASGEGIALATLSGTFTMTYLDDQFQSLNGGVANRDVVLPTADAEHKGVFYCVYNRGATNSLVIKDVAATVLTLGVGESGICVCDGTNWKIGVAMPASASLTATANAWNELQSFQTGIDLGDNVYINWSNGDLIMTGDGTDVVVTGTGDLVYNDSVDVKFGTGKDIGIAWDGTRLNVTQAAPNSEIRWGIDGAGIDQMWYGDTASASMLWDQSADALVFGGAAKVTGLRTFPGATPPAITSVKTLSLADAGGVFTVAQTSAYDIALPDPTTAGGCTYTFVVSTAGAFNVTISTTGASTFIGTISNDVTSTIPATGSTLTIATGTAAVGDSIIATSLTTGLYFIRAVTSAPGGITIA